MNIIYLSPGYVNPRLFPTFIKTFEGHGHTQTYNPNEATHCFLELVSGIVQYDQDVCKIIVERNIPIFMFDNREWGSMKNEKWAETYPKGGIYFVRNMMKGELYPDNGYPLDWPYFPECDFPVTTKEELCSRPYDCCLISVESPARRKVVDAILKDGRLKLNYKFLDHTERMPYQEWVAEHRKAKLYISCEGGGMTNERPNQLFSTAAQLQVTNNHLPANPFTDGINCLTISENPTSEEIEKIVDILADKEWTYEIYKTGIQFTKENLSGEAVANYVLKTISNELKES
jgi:hypothetical protein